MSWLFAGLIGAAVGIWLAWIVGHLPFYAVVQSVAAFLTALVIGDRYVAAVARRLAGRKPAAGGVYFAVGTENLLWLAGLCAAAVVVHVGVGIACADRCPFVATHRASVLGAMGGILGSLYGTWAETTLSRYSQGEPP
jgi:hypothetical protein